jgi:inhibitor of KinA
LQLLFAKNNFKGFVETVPAYTSLAIFYDTVTIRHNYKEVTTAFDFVKMHTEKLINEIAGSFTGIKRKTITIPVYYNGEDLEHVAMQHRLSIEQVIKIHTEKTYRVFMIGFLPGFAYMGKLDERIATPRLSSPRTNVKAGSVGIAGFQTGIYPLNSPGGWQLIGQTALKIFDKTKPDPCLLQAGDHVQFISITQAEFEKLNEY